MTKPATYWDNPAGGRAYRQHQKLKDWIRKRDNNTCQLCGGPGDQVDHIIPWAISHDSTPANLRCLCRPCNLKTRRQNKRARLPLNEWYEDIRRQLKAEMERESLLSVQNYLGK